MEQNILNILYTEEGYRIIDWMNAKLGNPIYDYARSYVILNEVAPPLAEKYLLLLRENQMDFSYMDKAIYVMAVLRLNEVQHENTIHIINDWNVFCSKSDSSNS